MPSAWTRTVFFTQTFQLLPGGWDEYYISNEIFEIAFRC